MIPRTWRMVRFMRDHMWTARHLSEYLDGELGEADEHRVDRHVGHCPKCRELLASLRRTIQGLRSLGEDTHPGVADGVIQRLREQT